MGWRTVVSECDGQRAIAMSSKPTTDRSPGMSSPNSRRAASMKPMARVSLAQNTLHLGWPVPAIAPHADVGLLGVTVKPVEHAKVRAMLTHHRACFVGQHFLIGAGLQEVADLDAAQSNSAIFVVTQCGIEEGECQSVSLNRSRNTRQGCQFSVSPGSSRPLDPGCFGDRRRQFNRAKTFS